jgi:phosphatidylserine/phosphatidylglycerophosphate/cardiolipin synthase-like enzyme
VITGSHNHGYKASYANDENLLIIRGNRPLAEAYVTHIMDVYDHYRWRYLVQQEKTQAWTGLQTTPDWQERYFQPGSMAFQELQFWMSAAPSAPATAVIVPAADRGTPAPAYPAPGPLHIPVASATPLASTPRQRRPEGKHPRA